MEKQMRADRDKRASILTAEGMRQSQILTAEGQKQSAILTAEGRREAAFRDAEARERLAEAEAKATSVVAQAIAGNGVQATNYFLGTKYVEALAKMGSSNNTKMFFLPVEAAGVMASIAGIGEFAKEAQARALGADGATRPRGSVPSAG